MLRKAGVTILLVLSYLVVVIVGSFAVLWVAETINFAPLVVIWALCPFLATILLGWWARRLLESMLAAVVIGGLVGSVNAVAWAVLGLPTQWVYVVAVTLPAICGTVSGALLQRYTSQCRHVNDAPVETPQSETDPAGR